MRVPKRLRTLPTTTRDVILAVVATSDKGRFPVSPDGKRIRAAQGRSVGVDLGYAAMATVCFLSRHHLEQLGEYRR
ncbi:RNA 2'-phosphotransferase [Paraburkholderia sp. DD10]|uniref:RNA 2'-phosphotransferase n=1 Tax=Paraburkholderia sp. DD10 TaxID=3409691 RepID=UPI003BA3D7AD